MLIDTFGRKINYLRLSITDRCNLRCSYCMPAAGIAGKRPPRDVLSYEELTEITRAAVDIGVEKVRITGGEPLVRKGVVGFLAGLNAIPGLKKLVLTTNGVMLEEMMQRLERELIENTLRRCGNNKERAAQKEEELPREEGEQRGELAEQRFLQRSSHTLSQ